MKFTIISHAGLLVEHNGKQLLFDPWLLGSCYWRSWWNYPPPSPELIAKLNPDIIFLTHIHWDHFHGSSLKKFAKDTKFVVPSGNNNRIKRDLHSLRYKNVYEINHGKSYQIDKDFKITSYHFFPFLDSAAVIEVAGKTLLNLNDCKHMGATLKQITNNHKAIDFVFRSHSSANSRLCYQFSDDKTAVADDIDQYIQGFTSTVLATGAKYAIPFASNQCHLHKEVFHFNEVVQTPVMVSAYFDKHNIKDIELVTMVSGDSWSDDNGFGFELGGVEKWFKDRNAELVKYRQQKQDKLSSFYAEEAKATLKINRAKTYFAQLVKKIPLLIRLKLKQYDFCYVLYNDSPQPKYALTVNFYSAKVTQIATADIKDFKLQIHTSTFIFNRCIAFKIFSHLAISKRVTYKLPKKLLPKMQLLNLVFNLDEYELIPLRNNFKWRSLKNWLLRYRELWLYCQFTIEKVFTGKIKTERYLKRKLTINN